MTAYLGVLGSLVAVRCASSLRSSATRAMTYRTTIGGRRLVQVGSRGLAPREWVATAGAARPGESATLAGFVAGEFGPGPFWWVDEWAQVTNLLPPRAAALETPWPGTVPGGPLVLDDGSRVGRSLVVASGTAWLSDALPCVPGVAVTASAWLSAPGQALRVEVLDSAGSALVSVSASPSAAGLGRVSVTATPPAGAHRLRLGASGSGRVARPALTWTREPFEYHGGQGAPSVVIEGLDQDVLLAHREAHGRLAALSYRIVEVG